MALESTLRHLWPVRLQFSLLSLLLLVLSFASGLGVWCLRAPWRLEATHKGPANAERIWIVPRKDGYQFLSELTAPLSSGNVEFGLALWNSDGVCWTQDLKQTCGIKFLTWNDNFSHIA